MRELTDGATAIVRGAVDSGCNFFAGYPITPASQILMMMMREMPKVQGVAIQAEDEIASIGMCLGAAMSGARVMTATSGPGMSLYSENIGMAIMGEVPLVIIDVQRLGPATGGATTVGQGDVQFARWGTSGGYPLIVLAPASIEDCYALTRKAFDLSERFRCPVIMLTDKELNLTAGTVDAGAYEQVPVRERSRHPAAVAPGDGSEFAPYSYEPADGVPPMAHYGEDVIVRFTGSTHDEHAFITKQPPIVKRLNRHLTAKIDHHQEEIECLLSDLQPGARTLFLSYGVTAGAMSEAVNNVRAECGRVSALTLQSLWPVPEAAIGDAAADVDRVVVAELNLGQYRREVERLLPDVEVVGLNRVDGELIEPGEFEELVI